MRQILLQDSTQFPKAIQIQQQRRTRTCSCLSPSRAILSRERIKERERQDEHHQIRHRNEIDAPDPLATGDAHHVRDFKEDHLEDTERERQGRCKEQRRGGAAHGIVVEEPRGEEEASEEEEEQPAACGEAHVARRQRPQRRQERQLRHSTSRWRDERKSRDDMMRLSR